MTPAALADETQLAVMLGVEPADAAGDPAWAAAALTRSTWSGHKTARPPDTVATPTRLLLSDVPDTVPGGSAGWWQGVQLGDRPVLSPGGAGAVLLNMMTIPAAYEDEFNAWYDSEHIPRISALDGVMAARRFRMTSAPFGYAAIYHLADAALVATPAWGVAATTPWTRRIQGLRSGGARYLFDTPLAG